jgi:hypothetical protein
VLDREVVSSFSAYIGMPPCRLVSAIDHLSK